MILIADPHPEVQSALHLMIERIPAVSRVSTTGSLVQLLAQCARVLPGLDPVRPGSAPGWPRRQPEPGWSADRVAASVPWLQGGGDEQPLRGAARGPGGRSQRVLSARPTRPAMSVQALSEFWKNIHKTQINLKENFVMFKSFTPILVGLLLRSARLRHFGCLRRGVSACLATSTWSFTWHWPRRSFTALHAGATSRLVN